MLEHMVASIQVGIISVGLALPYIALIDIIVVGIIVTPPVFKTRNVIIEVVAVSFFSFSF